MRRTIRAAIPAAVATGTMLATTPALAQYYGPQDDAVGAGAALFTLFCVGLFFLLFLLLVVLNIWMFIDSILREEWEYPGGQNKMLWVVLLGVGFFFSFGWIVAIVYYFAVYRHHRRGTMARPPMAGTMPPHQGGYMPPPPAPGAPAPPGYSPPPAGAPTPPPPPPAAPSAPTPPSSVEEPLTPTTPPGPMTEPGPGMPGETEEAEPPAEK